MTTRVTVCTSFSAEKEPRGPRHAKAFHDLGNVHVTFIDVAPLGHTRASVEDLNKIDSLEWITLYEPNRNRNRTRWLINKALQRVIRRCPVGMRATWTRSLNAHLAQLSQVIDSTRPDLVMAHNIDTLYPAYLSARSCNAKLVFDSMEFHSDMGEGQDGVTAKRIRCLETHCFPHCSLITTVGQEAAQLLKQHYSINRILSLRNVPKKVPELRMPKRPGFNLYWRNSVIGLGQRGLGDAIEALAGLPEEIQLHLQGRRTPEHDSEIEILADRHGVRHRLTFHPPFALGQAIDHASQFQVGLCLEHAGLLNHEIALSNKVFDYHMAGLAIICSDLPAMRGLLRESNGGVLFTPGNPASLREAILKLYSSPSLLTESSQHARRYALENANLECEMQLFRDELSKLLWN